MSAIIGVGPVMMRAPGGYDDNFIRAGVTLPLIHWSLISGDAVANESNRTSVSYVSNHVSYAKDGDIILCHDLNERSWLFAERYLPKLEQRNFLLVTVQDLCVLRGVALTPGVAVYGCPPAEE